MSKKSKRKSMGFADKLKVFTLIFCFVCVSVSFVSIGVLAANMWTYRPGGSFTFGGYWYDHAATAYASGAGTEENPYLISTPAQLAFMLNDTTNWSSEKYYEITTNLDMSQYAWTPIGVKNNALTGFKGHISGAGGGKTISGLNEYITSSNLASTNIYAGFIGSALKVSLTDLTIEGTYDISGAPSYICAGGLVATTCTTIPARASQSGEVDMNNISIENVTSLIDINVTCSTNINADIGGFIGNHRYGGQIINSFRGGDGGGEIGTITLTYSGGDGAGITTRVGGFVGYGGKLDDTDATIGGELVINGCANYADIIANCNSVSSYFGGFVGEASATRLSNSINNGDITVTGIQSNTSYCQIGGFVGEYTLQQTQLQYFSIDGCVNHGNINTTGELGFYSGGILGALRLFGTEASVSNPKGYVINCENTGTITNVDNDNMTISGGIIGHTALDDYTAYYMYNTKNSGDINANDTASSGGLIGWDTSSNNNSKIMHCYNRGNINASPFSGGFVGWSDTVYVAYCYSAGSVAGQVGTDLLLGFASPNGGDSIITNAYACTSFEGATSICAGGTGFTAANASSIVDGLNYGKEILGESTFRIYDPALGEYLEPQPFKTFGMNAEEDTFPVFVEANNNELWINHAGTEFAAGGGTELSPFIINSPAQLALLLKNSNPSASDTDTWLATKYYRLGSDLDMSDYLWTPMGIELVNNTCSPVLCNIDGDGHTISGLRMNIDGNNIHHNHYYDLGGTYSTFIVGFIAVAQGIYEDITIEGKYNFSGEISGANNYHTCFGGFAGVATGSSFVKVHSRIQFEKTNVTVDDTYPYFEYWEVGGIVGYASSLTQFVDCTNGYPETNPNYKFLTNMEGLSNTGTKFYYGGICALGGSYASCINYADMGSSSNAMSFLDSGKNVYVGGIVGYGNNVIKWCENYGDIYVNTASGVTLYAAGIAGYRLSLIYNSTNSGDIIVTGSGTRYTGGILGYIYSSAVYMIDNCTNIGNISGGYAGGIIGSLTGTITLFECENTGAISGSTYAGGLVGYYNPNVGGSGTIYNSKNLGNVSGSSSSAIIGGLIGYAYSTASYAPTALYLCYNRGNVGTLAASSFSKAGLLIGNCFLSSTTAAINIKYSYASANIGKTGSSGTVGFVNGTASQYTLTNCFVQDDKLWNGVVQSLYSESGIWIDYSNGIITTDPSSALNTGSGHYFGLNRYSNSFTMTAGYPEFTVGTNMTLPSTIKNSRYWFEHGDTSFQGGDGTAASPYLIATPSQLVRCNSYLSGYYKLMCDLDMSKYVWLPIGIYQATQGANTVLGMYTTSFSFDGDGHTISGLNMDSSCSTTSGDYIGFIGNASGVQVRNLTIDGTFNVLNVSVGTLYAGGLIGTATDSTVYNITNLINITVSGSLTSAASRFVGGVIGEANYCSVINCVNGNNDGTKGNLSFSFVGSEDGYLGGIIGRISYYNTYDFIIGNCVNYGSIYSNSNIQNMGGIVGALGGAATSAHYTARIYECVNYGNVTKNHNGDSNIGGILGNEGQVGGIFIIDCENWAQIAFSVYSTGKIGGIVGSITGSSTIINRCINHSSASITGGNNVGGIVGSSTAIIFNSYNEASVVSLNSYAYVGGIAGTTTATIEYSYNRGRVGANSIYVNAGGIVGRGSCDATSVYNAANVGTTSNTNFKGQICGSSTGGTQNRVYFDSSFNAGATTATGTGSIIATSFSGTAGAHAINTSTGLSMFSGSIVLVSVDTLYAGFRYETWVSSSASYPTIVRKSGYEKFLDNETSTSLTWTDVSLAMSTNTTYSGGSGTQYDPYLISSAYQLQTMTKTYGSGATSTALYFKLLNDIDMSEYTWTPINYSAGTFNVVFDGNYHTINNLYLTTTAFSAGFISSMYGTISNLTVTGKYKITVNNATSGVKMAHGGILGIANYSNGITLVNCHNKVDLDCTLSTSSSSSTTASIGVNLGGVVGQVGVANISYCTNGGISSTSGAINYTETAYSTTQQYTNTTAISIGGVIGGYSGTYYAGDKYCKNYGDIDALFKIYTSTSRYIGGVCGYYFIGYNTKYLENHGDINVALNATTFIADTVFVGGVIGALHNSGSILSKINNCKNYGNLSTSSTASVLYQVGKISGISGVSFAEIEYCRNYGNIESYTTTSKYYLYTSGISGYRNNINISSYKPIIECCANYGNIKGVYAVGGISSIGHCLIYSCVNYGDIDGTGSLGGIVGRSSVQLSSYLVSNSVAIFRSCYNLGSIGTNTAYTTSGTVAGGLVGYIDGVSGTVQFAFCYNASKVGCANTTTTGLIYGTMSSSVNSSMNTVYACTNITGCVATATNFATGFLLANAINICPQTIPPTTAGLNGGGYVWDAVRGLPKLAWE